MTGDQLSVTSVETLHVTSVQIYSAIDYQSPLITHHAPRTTNGKNRRSRFPRTMSRPPEKLKQVVDAFRRDSGEGKPVLLKVQLS